MAVAGWAALLLVLVLRPLLTPEPTRNNVYLKVFAPAARHFIEQQPLYQPPPPHPAAPTKANGSNGESDFRFPVLAAALLVPFELCGDRLGSVLWRLLNLGVLLVGVLALFRTGFPLVHDRFTRSVVLLVVGGTSATSLNNGQANALVLGGLLLATAAAVSVRWWSAMLAVTASAAWKIYPVSFGLVLVALRPWLLARLLPALLAAALLPLLLQPPGYVWQQYQELWADLAREDRTHELARSYRDLRLLTAVLGLPLPAALFRSLQAVAGIAIALLCRELQRRGATRRQVLDHALSLTLCWCLLLGPATERATYALFGPVLAHGLVQVLRGIDRSSRSCWIAALALTTLDVIPVTRVQQAEHPWVRVPLPMAAAVATLALILRARHELQRLRGAVQPAGVGSQEWRMTRR